MARELISVIAKALNDHVTDKTGESLSLPENDPLDPCALTSHYFSAAECPSTSPKQKKPDSFFRHPDLANHTDRPSLRRTESDLMPQLPDSKTGSPGSNTEWGGPDPTCYEVPKDRVPQTYSSSAVWDPMQCPVVPLPVTTGIGRYRRDPNTTVEWREEKYKSYVSQLGPIAARQCGAFELAGIEPEPSTKYRKGSIASFSSNCSSSSQYSELSDEQGRILKVYRGFAASAYPSSSILNQKSKDARPNSVSSAPDQVDGPYPRQAIRPQSRKSFLNLELDAGGSMKTMAQKEAPPTHSPSKSSNALKLASARNAESAIDSDGDSWEEASPEIMKKPLAYTSRPQGGKNQAGKRGVAGKTNDYKTMGLDRAKTVLKKNTGAAPRRHSSHEKPISRRSISNEKKARGKLHPTITEDLVEAVLPEATIGESMMEKTEVYDLSGISEAEKNREAELATLKEDDASSISSASSERTALLPTIGENLSQQTRNFRKGVAELLQTAERLEENKREDT